MFAGTKGFLGPYSINSCEFYVIIFLQYLETCLLSPEVPAEDFNMNAFQSFNLNALLLVRQGQALNQCLQAKKFS